MKKIFSIKTMEGIVKFLLPEYCVVCGQEGERLCCDCSSDLIFEPSDILLSEILCWVPAYYRWSVVNSLIYDFKFRGGVGLSKLLARWFLRLPLSFDNATVVPVPIHKKRLKERGYHQTLLLALELKNLHGLQGVRVNSEFLVRENYEGPQSLLKKDAKRVLSISGSFSVNQRSAETIDRQAKIILLDDVITTGSTMNECAKVLRQAGFENIIGVALAKG